MERAKIQQIMPMLADEPQTEAELEEKYSSNAWVAEEKFNGERELLHIFLNENRITGRRVSDVTGILSEKTDNVPHLRSMYLPELAGTVLDGEMIHRKGFDMTCSVMGSSPERAVELQKEHGNIDYYVFDILRYCGNDITDVSFSKRRKMLESVYEVLKDKGYDIHVKLSGVVHDNKKEFFEKVIARDGEGIMLKNLMAPYEEGKRRRIAFTKVKKKLTLDCVILGFEMGKGKYNKEYVGAMILGILEKQGSDKVVTYTTCSGFSSGLIP